mmetsp:Transcript_22732/g.45539  ORF Transcript_22732/g.45539 Transcript_22732/m.45539 type:complete len:83 (+) Transcript_22732:711-959(+)
MVFGLLYANKFCHAVHLHKPTEVYDHTNGWYSVLSSMPTKSPRYPIFLEIQRHSQVLLRQEGLRCCIKVQQMLDKYSNFEVL